MCMKTLNTKLACKLTWACILFLLIAEFPGSAAEINDSLAQCAAIKDDNDARLKCFDDVTNKQTTAKETVITVPVVRVVLT